MPIAAKVATGAVTTLAATSLAIACMPAVMAYSDGLDAAADAPAGQTAVYEKTEVVYATLAADGQTEAAYVVNQFDVLEAGTVVDAGDYESALNLTNETPLEHEGDLVSFAAEEGAFYYQGNIADPELPWDVNVSYELDGKELSAEEVAGATGELAIHLTTTANAKADASFAESYMLQVTFTLNGDDVSGIEADGATVASSGRNRTVAFTALPGKDADCLLVAQVRDFEMAGIQIAALPYAMDMEMPDTDGMLDDMSLLSDAIAQLESGAWQLASGASELAGGAGELGQGAAGFGEGLKALDGSSAQLVSGSAEIKAALDAVAGGLAGAGAGNVDLSGLAQLGQLSGTLRTMAGAFSGLSAQVSQLAAGFDAAHANLAAAVAAIPAPTVGEAEIGTLMEVAGTSDATSGTAVSGTVSTLVQTYQAAQVVKGTYESAEFQQLVAGTSTMLGTLGADASTQGSFAYFAAALTQMADGIDSAPGADSLAQLGQLAAGLGELAANYGAFHAGLEQYAAGVGELAGGFAGLEAGVDGVADGASQLASGAGSLASGVGQLADETASLPTTMQDEIDAMMADYEFPEWEPISFVAPENESTVAVQFVMTTAAIEIPEPPAPEEPEEEKLTIIDRFLALFK